MLHIVNLDAVSPSAKCFHSFIVSTVTPCTRDLQANNILLRSTAGGALF